MNDREHLYESRERRDREADEWRKAQEAKLKPEPIPPKNDDDDNEGEEWKAE